MFDTAATLLVVIATPAAVGGSDLLHAAIDPLAMFLLGGAGVLFAALSYGIYSSWNDEMPGPHRLYSEDAAMPESSADAEVSRGESASTASLPDDPRRTSKLAS